MTTVAHVVGSWLRPTENWIEHQMRAVRRYRIILLAKHREPASRYPWDPAYVLADHHPLVQGAHRLVKGLTGVLPHFQRAAQREGAQLLHAHFGYLGAFALPTARSLGVPLVTSFYGVDMWKHARGVDGLHAKYASLFDEGTAFLVEGPAARDRLIEIGAPAGKVWIHRLGVNPQEIEFVERRPERDGAIRVLMAARFAEKKGLVYGLEAFCRVARSEPRLSLTIVGGGNGSEATGMRAELHGIATTYGLLERVHFMDFIPLPELEKVMREHHIFMQPSVHARNGDAEGGHPVILTQAAAAGMPILATRHCDIPEIVVDGETGRLCPERDSDSLAEALRILTHCPDTLAAMGRKARALVEARYDINRQTLDAVYDRLLTAP